MVAHTSHPQQIFFTSPNEKHEKLKGLTKPDPQFLGWWPNTDICPKNLSFSRKPDKGQEKKQLILHKPNNT